MDYIYFISGMASVIFGALCFLVRNRSGSQLSWRHLGAFGMLYGLSEWLVWMTVSIDGTLFVKILQTGVLALSFLFLLEFARKGYEQLRKNRGGVTPASVRGAAYAVFCIFLLIAVIFRSLYGNSGCHGTLRYFLGLPVGILSAMVICAVAREEESRAQRRLLFSLGVLFGAFAVFAGTIVPRSFLWPAYQINAEAFYRILGFPVQLVCGGCMFICAWILWNYFRECASVSIREYQQVVSKRRFLSLLFPVLVLVLAGGWVLMDGLGRNEANFQRSRLIARARIVAAMINPDHVKKLIGSPADIDTADYVRLRQQLKMTKGALPEIRFVYLMGIRNKEIVFLVDSEPETSKDYSPPGQVYSEATHLLQEAFVTGIACFERSTDRWGTWVTAFMPVKDEQTGRLVAILGIDISAVQFDRYVAEHRLAAILFVLLAAVLITSIFMLRGNGIVVIGEHIAKIRSIKDEVHRLSVAVEQSPSTIVITDPRGDIVYTNQKFTSLTGYTKDEAIGTNPRILKSDRTPPEVYPQLWSTITAGKEWRGEFCNKKKSGELYWEAASISPIKNNEGTITHYIAIKEDITERKKTEQALRESEQKYQALFESSNDAIMLLDRKGFVDCNPATLKIFGLSSKEEFINKHPGELSPPEQPDGNDSLTLANAKMEVAFAQGSNFFEWMHRRSDGTVFPVEVLLSRIDYKGGQILQSTVRDITERKRAMERDLRLAAIVATTDDAIVGMTPEGIVTSWNRGAERIYGYRADDVIGKSVLAVIPDELKDEMARILEKVRQGGAVEHYETWRRKKDGTVFQVSVTISAITDSSGRVVGVSTFSRDITVQKRAEEMLLERMRLSELAKQVGVSLNKIGSLRTVLQDCAEAIFKNVDAAFVRIWTLNQIENVLELQASAGMYTHIDGGHARVPVGQFKIGLIAQERIPHLTNNVIGDPRVHHQEWARKEGMVAFAGYPLIVEDQVMGVAALFARHPLSDEALQTLSAVAETLAMGIKRKEEEERLESAYRDLMQTQMKLVQSEKMASVGQLAAGVAHEINNPLAFVMGNLGVLKEYRDKIDEYVKAVSYLPFNEAAAKEIAMLTQKLKIVHIMDDMPSLIKETFEGADRIKNIVQGLRSFARLEVGETQSVEVNACIETALTLLMNELKYKAQVVKEFGTVSPISGYPQQISQVCMNILLNAAQAIDKYGTITIKTYEKEMRVVIEISDTGCGIPRSNIKKIFDPFFTTKDVGKGTGLGLSIVHGIVQRHKGTIEVDSEVGKGTTFVITFPIG